MPAGERKKAGDLLNERTPILTRKSTFAATLPNIEDIDVQIAEHGVGVANEPYLRIFSKINVVETVNCSNPDCYNGGFSLGSLIHEMVDKKATTLEKRETCQGYQGGGVIDLHAHKKCLNTFDIKITIKYKPEGADQPAALHPADHFEPIHRRASDRADAVPVPRPFAQGSPNLDTPLPGELQSLMSSTMESRRSDWSREVSEGLKKLESRGWNISRLYADNVFVDTMLTAAQVAMRSSQPEKHQALRNAVLNAVLPNHPDQSLMQMFLNLIDNFTPWHITILKFFQNPSQWLDRNKPGFGNIFSGGLATLLEKAYPELRQQRPFYDNIWNDLYQKGLVNTENLHGIMTVNKLRESRTTDIGDKFLAFIEDPVK
jgi:hypothetical protein